MAAPRQPRTLAGAPVHPWLGRRLRITRISHKGQRRSVNAVIVFHDPAESHPFHVLQDDGASAWLAIQESRGIVRAVRDDGRSPRLRARVSRRFAWLTPVIRRETMGDGRLPASGAGPEVVSPVRANSRAARRVDAAGAAPSPAPAFGAGSTRAPSSRPTVHAFGNASVETLAPSGPPHAAPGPVPPAGHVPLGGSASRDAGFGPTFVRRIAAAARANRTERPPAFPPANVPSSRVPAPGARLPGFSLGFDASASLGTTPLGANAGANAGASASPAERSPWDGILEEFGAASAPTPAARSDPLDPTGERRPSSPGEGSLRDRDRDPRGDGGPANLEALEAAARAVGAAAADGGPEGDFAARKFTKRNISSFFSSDSDAAQFRLDAPPLSLRGVRGDLRAGALENAVAVLGPASLALCAAAMREKRFPPSGVRRRSGERRASGVFGGVDDSRGGSPSAPPEPRAGVVRESFAARARGARCTGCDSGLELSFGFRACALCGEAVCADCLRERRAALAAELARTRPDRGSPGTSPGTDASAYVFLCVATPTCLASATAAARRAGLDPASRLDEPSADCFTVSSLRAAGGFRGVSGAPVRPTGTRTTSPEANARSNTRADADDALSVAPACVRSGEAFARFRAEARRGADGAADGAAAPALFFEADARVPASFSARLERRAGEMVEKLSDGRSARRDGVGLARGARKRRRARRGARAEEDVDDDSNDDDSNDDDSNDDDSNDATESETFDPFPSLSAVASRLATRAGAGELAADAADAGAAAREARRLFETSVSPSAGPEDGAARRDPRRSRDETFADSALFLAMRDGRPLAATTTAFVMASREDASDDARARAEGAERCCVVDDARARATVADAPIEPGGRATRLRFSFFGDGAASRAASRDETSETNRDARDAPPSTIVSALATAPFAELVHPLGALNVAAYANRRAPAEASARRDGIESRDANAGLDADVPERGDEAKPRDARNAASTRFARTALVSEASVEAAPLVDVSAGGGSARALENVVLETCARRGDVAVSLGVSALDACFAAAPERREARAEAEAGEDVSAGEPARLWTVFRREDAPLLARWLALRGSAPDEPCLAFEAQREARETAAALAAAARAARTLAAVDPAEAREASAAEAAAADARANAERAARGAYDAASAVSPRLVASALRRRDGFVLDDVSLEALRRDIGIAPAWRDVPQRPGEFFFVPAGCPRFAVAAKPHAVARWFFLSAGSAASALRLAHQSRFLASGHPERGDALRARAAVARAAMQMEARVREESAHSRGAGAREERAGGGAAKAEVERVRLAAMRAAVPGPGGEDEDRLGGGKSAVRRGAGGPFERRASSVNPIVA